MKKKTNNEKPTFDFERALSWSGLSCFDDEQWGDPEKWYQRYILGIQEKPTPELLFGSKIDKLIQNDPTFLPDLERFAIQQHKLKPFYNDIPLVGIFDQWDPYSDRKRLADDKTGKNPWTQAKANETGQLTMYATLLYLEEGIKPEEIDFSIRWMPTELRADMTIGFVKDMKVQTFNTKRTLVDVYKFLVRIEKTYKAMQEYVENHD